MRSQEGIDRSRDPLQEGTMGAVEGLFGGVGVGLVVVEQICVGQKQAHGSNWHVEGLKDRNDVQQKLQDDQWQSSFVSAPGQIQSGQIGQKIVLNLELADQPV